MATILDNDHFSPLEISRYLTRSTYLATEVITMIIIIYLFRE